MPRSAHLPRRRRRGAVITLIACLAPLSLWAAAAPAASAAAASTPSWPASVNLQQYAEAPSGSTVCPTAVVGASGTVSGAANLLCGGSGGAKLTFASGGTAPSIVLDYGRETGGVPYFDVTAETGTPTLQAGYSEGEQYESATGDGTSPWAEGDPARSDDYPVSAPGTITNRYVQGGERYEEITLTSPGSLTLGKLGIHYIADNTQPDKLAGYFDSSSGELNQIWYDSTYTDQLDSVPDDSLPATWDVQDGSVSAAGDLAGPVVGLLKQGSGWTDYTDTFETSIVDNQAGWAVRGQDANDAYVFILNDNVDTAGAPDTLQEFDQVGGDYQSLGSVTLPEPVTAGSWHTVSTTVSGSTISVSLDGTPLTSVTSSAYAAGTVGFREYQGEEADFKDLTVTSSSGATLYRNSLGRSSALSDFTVPGENDYASIVDGARRDRAIWAGDMNVEGPSVFYSTDDTAYIKGALQALGSYQLSSGFVTGDLPPQDPLHTGPLTPGTTGAYSATYSMYFVLGLGDYYLYSGDTSFVQQEWPTVEAELAWGATQLDSNGLFVTDGSDNADWDFYDGGKNGEVTEYNLLYYKTLLDGAVLASAAGDGAQAATYTTDAANLKAAINAHLYNSATGLYYLSNQDTTTVAQDANSLAVLYGVAPAAQDPAILASLKTDLWTTSYGPQPFSGSSYADVISPFVSGYELDASFASNDTADADALLDTVWGGMISPGQDDTGTMWENINGATGQPGFGSTTSLAHGWSTTPTSALSGYVLGVQPVTAGYATWTVEPHPGDVSWVEGRVPTPHGSITVDWAGQSSAGKFTMAVTAPRGTSGTIAVPTYGLSNTVVSVNGHVVWSNGRFTAARGIAGADTDSSYVYLTGVQSGSYSVTAASGR
jgi:alpha-L-rhamnosidase